MDREKKKKHTHTTHSHWPKYRRNWMTSITERKRDICIKTWTHQRLPPWRYIADQSIKFRNLVLMRTQTKASKQTNKTSSQSQLQSDVSDVLTRAMFSQSSAFSIDLFGWVLFSFFFLHPFIFLMFAAVVVVAIAEHAIFLLLLLLSFIHLENWKAKMRTCIISSDPIMTSKTISHRRCDLSIFLFAHLLSLQISLTAFYFVSVCGLLLLLLLQIRENQMK